MCCLRPLTFLPASIRRTARELNLPSDASYRFERGVDPGMVLRASQRADPIDSGDRRRDPSKGNQHRRQAAGESPMFRCDTSNAIELLGSRLNRKRSMKCLTGFGLTKISAAEITKWKIPSYRRGLRREVDLIEEVVRAYGANEIRERIAADSRLRARRTGRTIWNPRCANDWL